VFFSVSDKPKKSGRASVNDTAFCHSASERKPSLAASDLEKSVFQNPGTGAPSSALSLSA
jgi:hypothetical protein